VYGLKADIDTLQICLNEPLKASIVMIMAIMAMILIIITTRTTLKIMHFTN